MKARRILSTLSGGRSGGAAWRRRVRVMPVLRTDSIHLLVGEAATDGSSSLDDTALHRLCLALGQDLGHFNEPPPEYLSDLADTFKNKRDEKLPIGLRTLASVAIGYAEKVPQIDLHPDATSRFEKQGVELLVSLGARSLNSTCLAGECAALGGWTRSKRSQCRSAGD